jgi:hypothetical protein
MKRLALAMTLVSSAALLAGCIIVPPRHGGYRDGCRDGYRYGDCRGGYDAGGAVVVQPGGRP